MSIKVAETSVFKIQSSQNFVSKQALTSVTGHFYYTTGIVQIKKTI